MEGRLTASSAMKSRLPTSPITPCMSAPLKSATHSKYEKELKALKEENKKLRNELEDLRSLYNQLMKENSHECFDERRVMMLKSQVIQLERQVLLLSEGLGSRTAVLTEVENALCCLADQFRAHITREIRGPEVNVQRSELTQMVETAESARIKLFKNIENNTTDKLSRPILLMSDFLKPSRQDDLTLLDIASGNLEFLNLKHVGKLESSMCSLYKDLIKLHSLMEEEIPQTRPLVTSDHMTASHYNRTESQLLKCCALTRECCQGLMELSLLHPSAPLPPLKKSTLKDVTCDVVIKSLPPFPRSKTAEVQKTIEALVKAFSFKTYMGNQQVKALNGEVKFHKSVYNIQLSYIESLFQAIRQGYTEFEQSTQHVVVEPLRNILQAYNQLTTSASETALRDFLTLFKNTEDQLQEAVDTLSISSEATSPGQTAISSFGEEFFKSLDNLVMQCQKNRDKRCLENDDLRAEQEKLNIELQNILEEQTHKFAALKKPIPEDGQKTHLTDVLSKKFIGDSDTERIKKGPDLEPSTEKGRPSTALMENKKSNLILDEISADLHVTNPKTALGSKSSRNRTNAEGRKAQKPQNYVPNLAMPSRTLTLKRQGSLPKLPWDSSGPEVAREDSSNLLENTDFYESQTTIFK
ncbi:hypothetical protein ScPMuIL_018016 [Solemya velum]